MSENDDLPSWTRQQRNIPQEVERRRTNGALIALAAFLGLVGMGTLGYYIAQTRADSETTAGGDIAGPTVDSEEADTQTASSTDGDDASDEASVGDDGAAEGDEAMNVEADADDADAVDTAEPVDSEGDEQDSGRTAVFRGGKLYLGGKVPSQEVADFIIERANSVVGPDNVVAEYEIDPTVVIDPGESTPLYVEDVVLFGFNSVEIAPPFFPLLDLGTQLLSQNPQATLTVVTHTDSVGSEEVNLEVAQRRADAVIAYWLDQGVDPDQLRADPRGEEEAQESDDDETAQLRRRAEFIITGLLD